MAKEKPEPAALSPGDQLVSQITTLDRSEEPLPSLLDTVMQLLELPVTACATCPSPDDLSRESLRGPSPLDDWALKWGRKRMNAGLEHGHGAAMDHRAWALLSLLIARSRSAFVARCLADFKFSTVLALTVQRIGQRSQSRDSRTPPREPEQAGFHAVSEIPHAASSGISRKRKRAGSPDSHSDVAYSSCLSETLVCILGVLRYIESLLKSRNPISRSLESELLRLSVQLDPEQAAKTLGAYAVAIQALGSIATAFEQGTRDEQGALFQPFVFLWETRSRPADAEASLTEMVGAF